MIRLEALRTFVTVADCGNIRDAAERLYRTPSAVSMTLKQLEERLGSPLFETDRKHSLSPLGGFVREIAAVLLRDHDRAIELIEAYAQDRAGPLRLASVPSVAAMLMPGLLHAFVAERPGVRIELIDTDSTGVRDLVLSGQADLGIASPPGEAPALNFEPLFRDPFLLICRTDSPLMQTRLPLQWAALAGHEMIVNEATRGLAMPGLAALTEQARLRVRNVTSLLAMVQAGIGVTLLPALATAALPATLRALPLADPACLRTVGLIARAGKVPSPVAAAFGRHFAEGTRAQAAGLGLSAVAPLSADRPADDARGRAG